MSVSNTCAQTSITLQLLLYACTSIGTMGVGKLLAGTTIQYRDIHLHDNQTLL